MRTRSLFTIICICILFCLKTGVCSATPEYSDRLSDVKVNAIAQDSKGYIWFATRHGLNRYNGSEYLRFYASYTEGELDNDYIYDVAPDAQGNVWLGTRSGLHVYNGTNIYIRTTNNNILYNPAVRVLDFDENHVIATGNNGIQKFIKASLLDNSSNQVVVARFNEKDCSWIEFVDVSSIHDVWFAATKDDKTTLYVLDENLNKIEDIDLGNTGILRDLCANINNTVWVATNKKIHAFDITSRQEVTLPEKVRKLTDNRWIHFIKKYGESSVLIGLTNSGMYIYDFRTGELRQVHPEQTLDDHHYICSVDKDLNIWISDTEKEPVCYTREQPYRHYSPSGGNSSYIHQMAVSKDGTLLLNTELVYYTYGLGDDDFNQYFRNTGYFTNQFYDVSSGDIWISTGHDVAYRYSLSGKEVKFKKSYSFNNDILGISKDAKGNMWFFLNGKEMIYITPEDKIVSMGSLEEFDDFMEPITDYGSSQIYVNTDRGAFYECTTDGLILRQFPKSISCITTSKDGSKWIGTHGNGLIHFFPETGEQVVFTQADRIISNEIKNVIEDRNGNIWFSTAQNITKYDVKSNKFMVIHDSGFTEDCFYEVGCGCIDKDNNIYFAGDGGITMIPASETETSLGSENLSLTLERVSINNQDIGYLPERLSVKHNQRNLAFRFAVLKYGIGPNMNFFYKLDGFEKDWQTSSVGSAVYNNLNPGSYTFHARVSQLDGVWSDDEITIPIRIKRPWWESIFAITIYLILAIATIVSIVITMSKIRTQDERLSLSIAREDLKQSQIDFLTNISHEFRTPLSLIYGPLKQLSKKTKLDPTDISTIQMMERNASRLNDLSEKILNASSGEVKDKLLRVSNVEMASFIKEISDSFRYTSTEKDIKFTTSVPEYFGSAYIDSEKVEKILFNLLSNAFKYTPEHGEVSLNVDTVSDKMIFVVEDNGIGIAEDKRSQIFDRFDRLGAESLDIKGSGIGLHYAQALAHTHKGDITFKPSRTGGSIFTLTVPCVKNAFLESEISESGVIKKKPAVVPQEESPEGNDQRIMNIVLAEDNADVRVYLKSLLSPLYNVTTCSDGEEALEYITTIVPDLIVSDIMMPNKDGYTLCQDVKGNSDLSHIPFVLLTAKTDLQSSIKGLKGGAEAYIPKPFDPDYLIATIGSILENRRRIQQKTLNLTSSTIVNEPVVDDNTTENTQEFSLTTKDKAFLEKIYYIIDENLSDESFNIESLTKEIGMSYSVLYGRIKALTGHSPKTFIETYRMNKAMEMILAGEDFVADIAAAVGSSSPSNFARSFKKQFDKTPTEVIKNIQHK